MSSPPDLEHAGVLLFDSPTPRPLTPPPQLACAWRRRVQRRILVYVHLRITCYPSCTLEALSGLVLRSLPPTEFPINRI